MFFQLLFYLWHLFPRILSFFGLFYKRKLKLKDKKKAFYFGISFIYPVLPYLSHLKFILTQSNLNYKLLGIFYRNLYVTSRKEIFVPNNITRNYNMSFNQFFCRHKIYKQKISVEPRTLTQKFVCCLIEQTSGKREYTKKH